MDRMEKGCVAVVVDRAFGERLVEIGRRMPVWIVDSPENRPWVDGFWTLSEGDVTRFTARDGDSPEAMALAHLADVDLHHEWSELAFFGVAPTEALRRALKAYGVDRLETTEDGFVARRTA